jgi:hypothetical protein
MQKSEHGDNGAVRFKNLILNRGKNNAAVTEGDLATSKILSKKLP